MTQRNSTPGNVIGPGPLFANHGRTGLPAAMAIWFCLVLLCHVASGEQTRAILIGAQAYQKIAPLRYTVNDVEQLASTLSHRCGVPVSKITKITDSGAKDDLRPFKDSIQNAVTRELARASQSDIVIVFFSGHGVRDKNDHLYLAPLDCDPDDIPGTGIRVGWLREKLSDCQAKVKLLVLDSCHAGSDTVSAETLGETFRATDVFTLASSTADQKSQIWEEKRQSLFSYWLVQALKGHADRDNDGSVNVDELFGYLRRTVSHTAHMQFPREQTPARIIGGHTPGIPAIVKLTPQPVTAILNDMSEQIALAIAERRLASVGVLEFTAQTPWGELLGADYGMLGKYCAKEVEAQLTELGLGNFSVVNRRRLQRALDTTMFSIDDLGDPRSLDSLAKQSGAMPAIVVGTIEGRTGSTMHLRCELLNTSQGDTLATVGGKAMISSDVWAMLGKSADTQMQTVSRPNDVGMDRHTPTIVQLDARASDRHPMQTPQFPFPVSIRVGDRELTPEFRGNDMIVRVQKGDELQIRVTNRSPDRVLMRLLIDGLNTLPQRVSSEHRLAAVPERFTHTKGLVTYEVAPLVGLDEARAWGLQPGKTYQVNGFASKTGTDGTWERFRVVDIEQSLAQRKRFTDQIGIITAAFYSDASESPQFRGNIGIGLGATQRVDLTEKSGQIGELLAVVHIKYLERQP